MGRRSVLSIERVGTWAARQKSYGDGDDGLTPWVFVSISCRTLPINQNSCLFSLSYVSLLSGEVKREESMIRQSTILSVGV